jgi:hypothetical protein
MNKKQDVGFKVFALMVGLVALMAVWLCVTPAFADNLYGAIRGVVADSSGAVLPGVQVKVTNVNTGTSKALTTGADGGFFFVDLQPGRYDLSATKANFKLFQTRGIEIIQNQTYVQNMKMEVGAASEVLEVTANAAQVETTSIQLGATLSGNTVTDLPVLNRNWITLQQTLPGVVIPDTRFTTNFATNGSQAQQNSFLVNGNDANDLPLNSPLTQPSPDAIAEVQMVTNTINPEFGRNSGAIMNATTKSGSNSFHGSAFEFYRDTFLNTHNFFQFNSATDKGIVPKFHQHQAGGTIGGPIWKNKTFFFFSYQLTRQTIPGANFAGNTTPVYTDAQRGGDFSTSTLSGTHTNPFPIVGSNGTTYPAGTPWTTIFPTGIVPTADFNSESSQLMSFVPNANCTVGGSAVLNAFCFSPGTTGKTDQFLGRLDQNLGSKDTIWFYALANDSHTLNDIPFSGATLPGFGDSSVPYTKQFTSSWMHTVNTNIINELRLGYTRLNFATGQPQKVVQPKNVGFSNIFPQISGSSSYPFVGVNGLFNLGGTTNGPQPRKDQTYQITDNFSWIKGRHAMKFGYDGRRFQVWNPFGARNNGDFTFKNTGKYSTGDAGLDFLLGIPLSYNQQTGSVIIAQAYEHYFYFQDQWRIKDNLTLTLGTGYQIDTPLSEYQNGGLSRACFIPGEQSNVYSSAPLGYVFPGDPGCNKAGGIGTKLNHFGPRVGFAWSPNGSNRLIGGGNKTSVRGGFGLYYNRGEEELNLQDLGVQPFGLSSLGVADLQGGQSPSFPDPFTDIASSQTLPNPFPHGAPALGSTPSFTLPFGINVANRRLTAPYAMNWNVTLQRELPARTILSVGYVGAHGGNLITSYTFNPTTPAGVTACLSDPNNISGGGAGGCADSPDSQPVDFPGHYQYPGDVWGNSGQQTNGGWSNYNALQVTVNKHTTHGLEVGSAYTWSHSLDVSSSFEDTSFQGAGGVDPYGNFARDYGASAFDTRQRWVVTMVYDLPNLAKALQWSNGAASRVFGGWRISGINAMQTGEPILLQADTENSLTCADTYTFYSCADRPDQLGPVTKLNPRLPGHKFFDTTAYTPNAVGTLGTTKRGSLYGPAFWNTDFTFQKNTMITEGKEFEMRIDFFNLFNHTNFANPHQDLAGDFGPFGAVGGIRSGTNSRLIQLSARFTF